MTDPRRPDDEHRLEPGLSEEVRRLETLYALKMARREQATLVFEMLGRCWHPGQHGR
jgi:hypothetical protein